MPIVLFLALLLTAATGAAYAQSSDSANPDPITNDQVSGNCEAAGQNYYWTTVAGPGDLNIVLSGKTDSYSAQTELTVSDSEGRELADLQNSANSTGGSRVFKLHLTRRQTLKMRLSVALNVGVNLSYSIKLKGASAKASSPVAQPNQSDRSTFNTPTNISENQRPSSQGPPELGGDTSDTAANATSTESVFSLPIEDKWALVVGVSKFANPAINLNYPAKDAKDLSEFLIKEGNFQADHVKLLVNEEATKENVMAELGDKWLPRLAHPNDLVLIFLSTHGSPSQADVEGLNYLVMHNTDPNSLYATGLPIEDLAAAIKHRVHANRIVLVIDACHSGAANPAKGLMRRGNFDSAFLSQGTGQLIICSSAPNQVSWESKRYPNGVFTRQLIEALRKRSGKISLEDAFTQLKEAVQSEVLQDRGELQTAVMKSKWQGRDLIITLPGTKPRAVPPLGDGL